MKQRIIKLLNSIRTGDDWRGTPKMFASAKFWGRKSAGPVFTLLLFIAFIYSSNASALTYQSATDLEFTFNPTLTIETPADLVISDLAPGSSSDSNIITVNTSSNSMAGYVVQASVGNASHATTELPLNGNTNNSSTNNNGSSSLSFIATDNTKTSVSNLDPDTWGSAYIYCNQEATNCNASGANPTWSSWTNYLALPLYNDAVNSPITISSRNDAGAIAFQFKIGAKSSTNKTAGSYNNVINFIMTANQITTNYTINYRDSDGTSAITPTIASQSGNGIEASTNVVLSSTIPTKTGYTFIGWCDGTVTSGDTNHSNGVDSCGDISKVYQPGSNYTVRNIGSTNYTITLRAMWRRNTYNVLVTFAGLAGSVGSVSFENTNYDTVNVTEDGQTASLLYNVPYTITMTPTSSSFAFDSWATTANGALGSTTDNPTTYTVTGDATLTVSGKENKPYIQDLTLANCPTDGMTVYDKRDEKDYTVKKINGQCWMTQNLRYLGDTGSAAKTMTIGNNNSNVANKSITLYSLNSSNAGSFNAFSSHCDDTNSYNYACVYDSGNTSTGVWYNYYAASAGTISTNSNSTAATSDICPAGWHLPSGPSTTANTDYNKLVGNTTSGYQDATSGLTAFSAVAGGYYLGGSFYSTGYGYWWSATAYDSSYRYSLGYSSDNGQFRGRNNSGRYLGNFVRCVRSS